MSAPSIMQDGNRLVVFGSQLIGVVIVVISLLTQQGELHSLRPPGRANMSALAKTEENDRFARLWDDPLEDASPSPAPTDSPTPAPSPTPTPETESYMFLWNILDAGPWPAARERRLRIRYAIVSAILAEGYRPSRGSVLHSLRRRVGRFETFRKPGEKNVCAIWTPKQSTTLPIDQQELGEIKDEIGKQDNVIAKGDVEILHHGTSQDLYNYLAAPSAPTEASPQPCMLFMRATIPRADLDLAQSRRPFVQKVTTDDKLVDALFRELCLRIPALNDPCQKPRIVVFTESDTIYSKAIVRELEQQLEQTNVKLEVYSYLQALDGRPEEARAPAAPGGSKPPDIATFLFQGKAISETSFGTSQFDYLRRAALDLDGKKNRRRDKVAAVGILGSDIYDKVLVLQAVRPALPSAVFFTTDLDALYLEREMQPFARNLVVASADDLDANEDGHEPDSSADDLNVSEDGHKPDSRWKLPPMRDSYQTVLVKEVRRILAQRNTDATCNPGPSPSPANVFEIAAGQSIPTPPEEASCLLWLLAQWWFNLVIFLFAMGNGFLILWAITTRQPKAAARMTPGARKLVGVEITLACVGLLFLLYKLCSDAPSLFSEPLALGVSIWPSVMIRLLAFLVAIVLLCLASHSFVVCGHSQKDHLKEALAGRIQFEYRPNKGGWLNAWFGLAAVVAALISRLFRYRRNKGGGPNRWSFAHFFKVLFGWSTLRCRIVIISILYLLFSFILFFFWPPTVPARGAPAFLIEKIILALGVALYIIHLVFCLDLHMCALSLLRAIHAHFQSEHEETGGNSIDIEKMLASLSTLTMVIGKTLLYPLTVLILIILSRLDIFDNWVMTPSLVITFALGAIVLIGASLHLWLEGAKLRRAVLAQTRYPAERAAVSAVNDGVFAAWYNQPIFSAILSALAVFGSLSVAGPLTRLFFAS